MRNKKAIAIGALAGILAFGNINSKAQNLESKIQYEIPSDNSKIEIQKTNVLDSFVNIYNTPASIQRYVAQNIEYIKGAEKFYPEVDRNSTPKGFIRFPSPEQILEKKYGDCEEGFILTASALKKLGYETIGLAMNPKNGESGHIFTIYKDTSTNLYGTAGISVEDYISPVYNSIENLITGLALKSKYHDFNITSVKVTDEIFSNSNHVDLPKEYVKDMNLTDIFGVLFKTENTQFGKLEKEIYEDNYRINLGNTIIEPKNPVGIIKGPITEVELRWKPWGSFLEIDYNNDHRYSESITLNFEKEKLDMILLNSYDRAKGKITCMERYYFNKEKNNFCQSEYDVKNPKCISQKESQEYLDLANYFLILMKDQETKALWEQTKMQREIKNSKQDSLQINFPKD
ncbi:MAG: transglutaminase-like domain-containing protein [Nanoarchaeota archaeon]